MIINKVKFTQRNEQGLTLVELLVYMLLASALGAIVGTILINSLKVQTQVVSTNQQSMSTQQIAHEIERSIRNAKNVKISPNGAMIAMSTFGGKSEDVTLGEHAGNWACRAWIITEDGEVWRTQNSETIKQSLPSGTADVNNSNWTFRLDQLNLQKENSNTFTGKKHTDTELSPPFGDFTTGDIIYFSLAAKTLKGMQSNPMDVSVNSSTTIRPQVSGGTTCW